MQGDTDRTNLLLSVAEQLKMPLSVIARQTELAQIAGGLEAKDIKSIGVQADAALTLVDSYLLGLELLREQANLQLEPVSVSSVLCDAAHALSSYGKVYDVDIDLNLAGKYGPVMAHRRGLMAALLSLGFELIEALPSGDNGRRHLTLAAHRTGHGIVAGVYGQYEELTTDQWRRSLRLFGRAHQPLQAVSAGSSAGLFVADTIFQAMFARLRASRYNKENGLAATLAPSHQLALV